MKVITAFLFMLIVTQAASAAEFIGAPLNTFRRQKFDNCWAISGLQYLESVVQAQTGVGYYFSQDKTFWYEIFKQRLLLRWKNKAPLAGGLGDDNIFTDFGFPEAVPALLKNSKLAFYHLREGLPRKPGSEHLMIRPQEEQNNEYTHLQFSSQLKKQLELAETETQALAVIDSFLHSKGLKPEGEDFVVNRNRYSRKSIADSLLSLPQVRDAMDLVWVSIDSSDATTHSLSRTAFGVTFLRGMISKSTAEALANRMWESKLPVIVSSRGHSWMIPARDTQSSLHVVADSKFEKMKRDYYPWDEVVTIHVPKKILEQHFRQSFALIMTNPASPFPPAEIQVLR